MIDETNGRVYQIPPESIVLHYPTATSSIRYALWCEHVLNAKQDVYAYINAEMILSITGSSAPTCILKHEENGKHVYAQILEIDNAPVELAEYGVDPKCLGGCFLWPLSYNQHNKVWNKVLNNRPSNSMADHQPVLSPSMTDAASLRFPYLRPRPCDVRGAREVRTTTSLSGTDRFSMMLFPVSPFLFRDGGARRDRYRRAFVKYIEQLPNRNAHKKRVAMEMTSRKRSDRSELRELYVQNAENCKIARFIRNVPGVIDDLRAISGAASGCLDVAAAACASSPKRRCVAVAPPVAAAPAAAAAACCFDDLPPDMQGLILRRACASVLSEPDIGLSKQRACDLRLVSKSFNRLTTDELYSEITVTIQRVVGSITDGGFDPYRACIHSYRHLSCPPHSLLEVHASLSLAEISKLSVVKRYFRARFRCNVSAKVCSARAMPLNGSSLARCKSAPLLEGEEAENSAGAAAGANSAAPFTRRLDELWGVYNSQ